MLREPDALLDAAAAISDGRAVDWDALVRDADDEELRRQVLRLRRVAEILGGHDAFHGPSPAGEPAAPAPALRPGLVLGSRYRVERRLGSGGMGEVWLAFDLKLGVDVALKAIRADGVTPRRRELLRGEVRAARQVISPHVCRIFDLVEADGGEMISMEAVDGVDLARHLRDHGPMDLGQASDVASQLLAGLQAIHDAGVVHRDLKPGNVMITPAGRVVVMDFGIAKETEANGPGAIAGTPAYMAPEQLRGDPGDARADLYSAGLVLLELVDTVRNATVRDAWQTYHGAWRDALLRALSVDPSARYASAREFSRALESATLRSGIRDEHCPYPGLAAFTEADTRFFFGREAEVEALVRKLWRLPMTAIVGPSGVGKSSLLRAGLLPSLPEGWAHVTCTPGGAPFVSVGRGLAPHLASDPEAIPFLARIEAPDVAVSLFRRWRGGFTEAVLVIDQFEELFTQNAEEVQARFADFLGRLTLEADVRIVLSMRDDFLFRCHAFPGLRPILTELSLVPPLRGADLRRSLVQPALACGYRFEDDALVDEIVDEVERERGALPLLAFTASRLWAHRDREDAILPRKAYVTIGGLAGSLAQHAEATLERIGEERQPIVREMFRALVTTQGTRLSLDREELLAVVDDREAAEATLDRLVEARLLTTFESADPNDPARGRRRVELIHESLLSHWPRLVRWQTQDADGAQFRDQLRQAARLWDESGRPEDMLWTGSVYDEFRLWRDRYPGKLTGLEETFGEAAQMRARHRRRKRIVAVAAAIAVLAAGLAVTGTLWRRSERAQARAVAEARRAEAEKLYTLAQSDDDPPSAFAYALAALELSDQPAYRRFALQRLLRAPLPFRLPVLPSSHNVHPVDISPDGKWMAMGWSVGAAVELYPLEGGEPRVIGKHGNEVIATRFSDDSSLLVTTGYDAKAKIWSIPDGTLLRTLDVGEITLPFLRGSDRLITYEFRRGERPAWRSWSLRTGAGRVLGTSGDVADGVAEPSRPDVDPSGRWAVVPHDRELTVYSLESLERGPVRILGSHPATIRGARFAPDGDRIASFDDEGGVRLWSLTSTSRAPLRSLRAAENPLGVEFERSGSRLVAGGLGARLWDLASPGVEPDVFHEGRWKFQSAFDPAGRWLVTAGIRTLNDAWPVLPWRPVTLAGTVGADVRGIEFTGDGRFVAVSSHEGCDLRIFRLEGAHVGEPEILFHEPGFGFQGLFPDARGRTLVTAVVDSTRGNGTVVHVTLPDRTVRTWPNGAWNAVVDADGRRVAARVPELDRGLLRVWDSRTGATVDFGTDATSVLGFARDGRLLARTMDGVWIWDVAARSRARILEIGPGERTQLCPDRETIVLHAADGSLSFRRLDGSESRRSPAVVSRVGLMSVGADLACELLVFGRENGDVEVVRTVTGEMHRMPVHDASVGALAVDPLGRWIASAAGDGAKLWKIPEGPSPLDLPAEAFLRKAGAFTNLRAVRDDRQPNGYALRAEGLPDWKHPPTF